MDNKNAFSTRQSSYPTTYQPVAQPTTPGLAPPPLQSREQSPALTDGPYVKPEDRSSTRRLGSTAIVTILLGTLVELGTIAFLVYFWTGRGANPDGGGASSLWRYLALNNYATRTVTICALVLRTAVDLKAVVCTGLAAGLLLESRSVYLSDVATFSMLQAVNGGPSTLAKKLAATPWRFFRSLPAFMTLLLLLICTALQFSSTLLLSDFRPASVVADAQLAYTPILQTLPELLSPYQSFTDTSIDFRAWRQALTSFPAFAEQKIREPLVEAGVSDTGLIKRALIPLDLQRQQTLRRFEGAAITHTSQVACVRPELKGSITPLINSAAIPALRDATPGSAMITGTLSWPSQSGHEGMGSLDCGPDKSCPPVPITCALPFSSQTVEFTSILDQTPTTICLFNSSVRGGLDPSRQRLFVIFTSTNTGGDWVQLGSTTNGTVDLPDATETDEWAVFTFGTNISLSATMCMTNSTLIVEDIIAGGATDPGELTIAYTASNKSWSTDHIIKMTDIRGTTTDLDRGIMTIDQANPTSTDKLNVMYQAAGVNYKPDEGDGDLFASQFMGFLADNVFDPISITNTTGLTSNSSIYMCSMCFQISGTYFDPHPYTVLLFHAVLRQTGKAAHALHSTLFWLTQAEYYNALPGFDFGTATSTTHSQPVTIPLAFSGLVSVVGLLLLEMLCVAILTVLFLLRTQYSVYGNAWQAAAQLLSPDTRHLLDRAALATDGDVSMSLKDAGWDRPAGVVRMENGRVGVVRRGTMSQYGQYS